MWPKNLYSGSANELLPCGAITTAAGLQNTPAGPKEFMSGTRRCPDNNSAETKRKMKKRKRL